MIDAPGIDVKVKKAKTNPLMPILNTYPMIYIPADSLPKKKQKVQFPVASERERGREGDNAKKTSSIVSRVAMPRAGQCKIEKTNKQRFHTDSPSITHPHLRFPSHHAI